MDPFVYNGLIPFVILMGVLTYFIRWYARAVNSGRLKSYRLLGRLVTYRLLTAERHYRSSLLNNVIIGSIIFLYLFTFGTICASGLYRYETATRYIITGGTTELYTPPPATP